MALTPGLKIKYFNCLIGSVGVVCLRLLTFNRDLLVCNI